MSNEIKYGSLIKNILIEFIDYPDDLTVNETRGENIILITVLTNRSSDVAKILGKGGIMLKSLKNILFRIAAKNKQQCRLSFVY